MVDFDEEDDDQIVLVTGGIDEDDLTSIEGIDIQNLVVSPTDWTISVLADLLKRKKINLQPNYQRRIAWTEGKMSRFIESLFLRLPVPQIVLAETKPGQFAVIDGKQRINSISRFCIDKEEPLKLRGCEYLTNLNGMTYSDIENDERYEEALDTFQSHTVRTTVIKNWNTDEILYLLFLRLNQNSVRLSPQELRRALYPGEFMNWLDEVTANSDGMRMIFNKVPDFRMRDMEVATRFLAFRYFAELYAGNMKMFLDTASVRLSESWPENQPELEEAWDQYERAIQATGDMFGKNAFRLPLGGHYQRPKNRAVMDIMTYYFSIQSVRDAALENSAAVEAAFRAECQINQEFVTSLQTSTKSMPATKLRFNRWCEALRQVIGDEIAELAPPNFAE